MCAIIARQRIQEKESTFYSETCDHSTCMYMRVFECRVPQEVAERERAREREDEGIIIYVYIYIYIYIV